MTREIKLGGLGGGHVALVDDDRYEDVTQYRWTAKHSSNGKLIYAARNIYFIDGSRKHQRMHNLITGWDRVDHKNHDGLDNRMVNLRFDPGGKNPKNRSPQTGTLSPYKGVMLRRSSGRWFVQITVDRCIKRVGTFGSEIDAALAYDAAAEIGHGEWACLNRDCFPEVMLAYHGHPH